MVFAGSFNPPHWGHLVMIRYLAERYFHSCKQSDIICNPVSLIITFCFVGFRYGSVICCIGFNPSKQYDVTAQQRADILKGMVSNISLNNVRVDGECDFGFATSNQWTLQ